LRLDKCDTPFVYRIFNGVIHPPDGYEKLVRALNLRANQLGKDVGNSVSWKTVGSGKQVPEVKEKKKGRRKIISRKSRQAGEALSLSVTYWFQM